MASNPGDTDAPSSSTSSKDSSPAPAPAASSFQFVNISSPTEIRGSQNRKLVRSSVAQNLRKQQILRHAEGSPHACLNPDVASMFPVLNFCPVCGYAVAKSRTGLKSGEQSSTAAPPPPGQETYCVTGLGAGRVDPFGAFPISVQPYMNLLVDDYLTNYSPTFQPFCKWDITTSPIITRLFRGFALQHPVYFHATLCIAAANLNVTTGRTAFKTLAAYHRGETIKLLNEMLGDAKNEITDLMIAVVGSLGNHDIMIGDHTALITHRNGLVEMIKQRGGIQSPSLMCLLRYRSIWIDFMSAVFSHTMPLFPDDPPYTPSKPIQIIPISTTGFHALVTSSNLTSPMIEITEELLSLTHGILSLRGVRATPDEMKSTTSRRARVERALYTSQFDSVTRGGDIQHCVRLAELIYAYCTFRRTRSGSAILSVFAEQLQRELEKMDLLLTWEEHPSVLLWILFMGGIALPTCDVTAKEFYTSRLISLCFQMELHTWEEVLELLRMYLWSEEDLGSRCKTLWSELVVDLRFT